MRIKLPRGRVLEGAMLAAFEHERDHLDSMMTQPAGRAAIAAVRAESGAGVGSMSNVPTASAGAGGPTIMIRSSRVWALIHFRFTKLLFPSHLSADRLRHHSRQGGILADPVDARTSACRCRTSPR